MFTLDSSLQKTLLVKTAYQIPILMPDEYWIGYLGRLLMLNGIKYRRDYGRVNNFFSNLIKETHPYLINSHIFTKIGAVSHTNLDKFIQRHTLIPFMRMTNSKVSKLNSDEGVIKILSFRFLKKGAYFCKDCVTEDMDYLGISFWRRSHQLPGIDWCIKHECILDIVNIKNAMHYSPNIHLDNKNYTQCVITAGITQNPIVKKFSEVIQDYANKSYPINIKQLAQLLAKKATKLNLGTSNKDNKKFISDFLIENTPVPWRLKHFPTLYKSTTCQYLPEFDNILLPKNEVKLVTKLLIISALLPNTVNVFNELSQVTVTVTKKLFVKITIPEEILIKAYIKHRGVLTKISKEINYHTKVTRKQLKVFGYVPLGVTSQNTIDAIISFYEGTSIFDLLNQKNINIKQFLTILRSGNKHMHKMLKHLKTTSR